MNRLTGTLISSESNGAVMRIKIDLGLSTITAVVIGETSSVLENGAPVTVCFKESETALAVGDFDGKLSIRNRLPCIVTSIEDDGILCRVNLDFCNFSIGALVTSESARDLGLFVGAQVLALVKSTEVMIAGEDA